jgi:hypothetical protein
MQLLSELGPDLTDQQIQQFFTMYVKLSFTDNAPGGGAP